MKTEESVMDIIRGYDIDAKVDDQLKDDLMFDSLDMEEKEIKIGDYVRFRTHATASRWGGGFVPVNDMAGCANTLNQENSKSQ